MRRFTDAGKRFMLNHAVRPTQAPEIHAVQRDLRGQEIHAARLTLAVPGSGKQEIHAARLTRARDSYSETYAGGAGPLPGSGKQEIHAARLT